MRFIIETAVIFWLSVYTVSWLIYYNLDAHRVNLLSYGIMEIVALALLAAWIEKAAEIKEIWDDLPD